jgi:hypothetical protein
MQTSGSARKLHNTFRLLHVSVSSVLAPSQLIRNRCCTSSSSSSSCSRGGSSSCYGVLTTVGPTAAVSSCSRGGSSSCYGVLTTVGPTAAVSRNRLSGRLYATDAAVSSTAGQEAKQLEPALYVVVSHFWPQLFNLTSPHYVKQRCIAHSGPCGSAAMLQH